MILGTNSVRIGNDVTVGGNVVVNRPSTGPTLGNNFDLYIDRKATITGDLHAESIKIFQQATINGHVYRTTLDNAGTITPPGTIKPYTFPVFNPLPAFQSAGATRGNNVAVGIGQQRTLAAGDYGNITVDTGGTVVFTGGTYNVNSIDVIADLGSLVFQAPSEVRIRQKFRTRRYATIGPASGSGVTASQIVFYVGGINGNDGGLNSAPEAARIGSDSTVNANFSAPNGTLRLEIRTNATGAFLGRDVMVDSRATVARASAFRNRPPTAQAQNIAVSTADPVTVELTGSDPEGDSLTFSIEASGTGALGQISEIQDPGVCSETRTTVCDEDSDCPVAETCVLPPVSRATVVYTASGCDASGCPRDAFTFGVKDSCMALATAVVDVNFVPDDPGGGAPNEVVAPDIVAEALAGSSVAITLTAGAPLSVASLTFAVESLPSAPIETEFGAPIATVPFDLPSPVVVYAAPSTPPDPPTDSFTFSARDSSATYPPCLSPACDTGTVNITIAAAAPLAPNLAVATLVNEPVLITLPANPGGSVSGSSLQARQRVRSPGYSYFYEAQPISSARDNGRPLDRAGLDRRAISAPDAAALVFDAGWSSFTWNGGDGAIASSNFTFSGAGCLSVTDDFDKGDVFEISDNGTPIFTTTSVPAVFTGTFVGADAAYLDPTYSSGSLTVGSGAHDITIKAVVSPWGGGEAYIRIDSGSCQPNLTVTSFSAPDSASLDQPIGSQILATVTNTGTSVLPAATSASIGYYVSADSVITTTDRLLSGGRENLSQQAPGGLAIGQSVQINLFSGATISSQFPDGEPLTGDVFIGVLVDEFNQVAETDEGDNTASEPIFVGQVGLVWTIETLPVASTGVLRDFSTGSIGLPITAGQTFALQPTLLFIPAVGFTGSTNFDYKVTESARFDIGRVTIGVTLVDTCTPLGRPLGCAPTF